jgi:hypothetical protein
MVEACAISRPALLMQIKELPELLDQTGSCCNSTTCKKIFSHMKFARFSIFTAMNRNTAISQVCDAVSESRGWIVDQSFLQKFQRP